MIYFSQRLKISEEAEEWCVKNNVKMNFFGCVCALQALGYLVAGEEDSEPTPPPEELSDNEA